MKRIIAVFAIAAGLFGAVNASARGGIIGGFTSSKTNLGAEIKSFDAKAVSLYHVGLTYQLQLPLGFSIQPSLLYQMKGSTLDNVIGEKLETDKFQLQTKAGFIELPVALQWGPDLLIARPYVFVEPFVGYRLSGSVGTLSKDWVDDALSKLEYGIGVGAGVEVIQHLQISLQWFTNLGPLMTEGKTIDAAGLIAGASDAILKQKNFSGIKVSAAIFF